MDAIQQLTFHKVLLGTWYKKYLQLAGIPIEQRAGQSIQQDYTRWN